MDGVHRVKEKYPSILIGQILGKGARAMEWKKQEVNVRGFTEKWKRTCPAQRSLSAGQQRVAFDLIGCAGILEEITVAILNTCQTLPIAQTFGWRTQSIV